MSQPNFLSVAPGTLEPNPWNTNLVTPENDLKLEESVKRNGLFKPIIVRELEGGRLQILGGEHRWQVAIKVGLAEVPVFSLGKVDDIRAKEISVIDNARYGDDDTVAFAELLKEIGTSAEIQSFLPFQDDDLTSIFSSSYIALDELDLDPNFNAPDKPDEDPEPPAARAPKTHTLMRFKVSIADSERLTKLIAQTQKNQGFTAEDDLTNAGDALVFLLLRQSPVTEAEED